MEAIIFDFDGVVIDSEPIHLLCFQQVMKTVGVSLSEKDYYEKYLGYDDHDCIVAASRDQGVQLGEHRISQLISTKSKLVKRMFGDEVRALPGAVKLIETADAAGVPMAICSGALKEEIELACKTLGIRERFRAVVAAQQVDRGKPDPQGYRMALSRLREESGKHIAADRCVVIEDSPAGIEAGRSAGMKVLAVTNSYDGESLSAADRIVHSLADIELSDLAELSAG